MHNKKLNKSIVTGLTAVTLFAPLALHNIQVNASNNDNTATTINSDSRITGITLDSTIDGTNSPSRGDFNDNDVGHITRITLDNSKTLNNNYKSNQGSQLTSDINDQYKSEPSKTDGTTTTINNDSRITGITLDSTIDGTNSPSRGDFNDNDVGHITRITLDNNKTLNNNYKSNQGSQLTSDINDQYKSEPSKTDGTTTTINNDSRITGITLDSTIDGTNSPSRGDFNDNDVGHITRITLDNSKTLNNNYKSNQGSQLTSDINDQYKSTNSTVSNTSVINTSSNTTNNNSNYTSPKINNGSKEASFPAAPKVENQENKKVSTKQLKKDKASVKKNQKQLNNIKKELKQAKSKSHKAKLNKQLKQAKKAFAKSEVQLNHAKHAVK